jgi:hypothetical protein
MRPLVRDFDALAVFAREGDSLRECGQEALVKFGPSRGAMRLQPFAGQVIDGGAAIFLARREPAPERLVLTRQLAELVGHARPCLSEGLRAGGVGLLGGFLQGRTHRLDLADPGAHLDGEVDREIPDIVGREIFEHRRASLQAEGAASACGFV